MEREHSYWLLPFYAVDLDTDLFAVEFMVDSYLRLSTYYTNKAKSNNLYLNLKQIFCASIFSIIHKIYYGTNKFLSLDHPDSDNSNPHLRSYFFMIHCNIRYFHFCLGLPSGFFPLGFLYQRFV